MEKIKNNEKINDKEKINNDNSKKKENNDNLLHKLWKLQKNSNNCWKNYNILKKKYNKNLISLREYKFLFYSLLGINLIYNYSNKLSNDNLLI